MGCGKSTIGQTVSLISDIQFIDLDNYIERRFHCSVKDLFASRGETGFREIERNVLHEVADFEDVIIACGGGTPCFFDNMQYMNAHGITVFLDTPVALLHSRLMSGRAKRPLIAGKSDEELLQFITNELNQRMKFYSSAKFRFSTESLESETEIHDTATQLINLLSIPSSKRQ